MWLQDILVTVFIQDACEATTLEDLIRAVDTLKFQAFLSPEFVPQVQHSILGAYLSVPL